MQDITVFIQHHWTLSTALIIILTLLVIVEFIKQKGGAKRLSPGQATQFINHQHATIVDIRSTDAYATGHIIGAISLPLRDIVDEKIKKLDKLKSHPIILTCATGAESPKAAALLAKKDFTVYLLEGGIRAWRNADMPIVKG